MTTTAMMKTTLGHSFSCSILAKQSALFHPSWHSSWIIHWYDVLSVDHLHRIIFHVFENNFNLSRWSKTPMSYIIFCCCCLVLLFHLKCCAEKMRSKGRTRKGNIAMGRIKLESERGRGMEKQQGDESDEQQRSTGKCWCLCDCFMRKNIIKFISNLLSCCHVTYSVWL